MRTESTRFASNWGQPPAVGSRLAGFLRLARSSWKTGARPRSSSTCGGGTRLAVCRGRVRRCSTSLTARSSSATPARRFSCACSGWRRRRVSGARFWARMAAGGEPGGAEPRRDAATLAYRRQRQHGEPNGRVRNTGDPSAGVLHGVTHRLRAAVQSRWCQWRRESGHHVDDRPRLRSASCGALDFGGG